MKRRQNILLILLIILAMGAGSNIILRANPNLLKNNLLGQIGVFVGVEQNPENTIARQLEKKEKELTRKEEELNVREKELQTETVGVNKKRFYAIFGIIGVLLLLIGANFYLDWRRK